MATALAISVIICTYSLGWLIYTYSELERTRKEAKLWYDTLKTVAQQRDESDKEVRDLKTKLRFYEIPKFKKQDSDQ